MMMMLIRAMEFYFVDNGYVSKRWENSDCYDLDDDYSGTPLIQTPVGHAMVSISPPPPTHQGLY